MSDPILRCHKFTVLSSLQEAVEQWEAETTGPADFLSATGAERVVDLDVGLLDPETGEVAAIAVMRQGVIDEWRLSLERGGAVSGIKGRDAIAKLLDYEFPAKRFARAPAKEFVSGESDMPTVVGEFRAREVAEEVAAFAGLSLKWECPDYVLWEDFEATGRCIDVITRLVQPWQVVDPFRVDIFADGSTVFLRQRTMLPEVADYVLEVRAGQPGPHAKILNLSLRRRRLPKWSGVQLIGRVEPQSGTHDYDPGAGRDGVASGTLEVVPFHSVLDEVGGKGFTPGRQKQTTSSSSYQPNGTLISRVVETTEYQMPDQVVLSVQRDTYSLVNEAVGLIKQEIKTIEYQPFKYSDKGPIASPVPIRERSTISQQVTNAETGLPEFRSVKAITTSHVYDEDNYLRTTSELTEMERDGKLEATTMIVKSYVDAAPLMHHQQTDKYRFERAEEGEGAGAAATGPTSGTFVLTQTDVALVAGHRPGGHGRGAGKPLGSDTEPNTAQPIFFPAHALRISEDPDAKPGEGGNEHMSEADLELIHSYYRRASGAWEVELEFMALTMPWLRRGKIVKLEGLEVPRLDEAGDLVLDEAGNVVMDPITLPPALIYHVRVDYDQGRAAQKRSISSVRAVFWEPHEVGEESTHGRLARGADRAAHHVGVS